MKDEKGFFLLETVMMGILLAAASSVLLIGMQAEELRQHSEKQLSAFFLAREQLVRQTEQCQAAFFGRAAQTVLLEESQIRNKAAFHLRSQVRVPDGWPAMREIRIEAEWKEQDKVKQLVLCRKVWLHE